MKPALTRYRLLRQPIVARRYPPLAALLLLLACGQGSPAMPDAGAPDAALPSGAVEWVRAYGGAGYDTAQELSVGPDDSYDVAGAFGDTMRLGASQLTALGDADAFIARVAGIDQFAWSVSAGSIGHTTAALSVARFQDSAVSCGLFAGDITLGAHRLHGPGVENGFVAKQSADGGFLWARAVPSVSRARAHGVAVDEEGDVSIIGYFEGDVDLGNGPVAAIGDSDVFVAKYRGTDGSYVWGRTIGSPGQDLAWQLAVTRAGNVATAGFVSGEADYGAGVLPTKGGSDAFVALYDGTDGSNLWAIQPGGPGDDRATSLAIDEADDVRVAGTFEDSVDFGGGPLGAFSNGAIFVGTYDGSSGDYVNAVRYGGTGEYAVVWGLLVADERIVTVGAFQGESSFGGDTLVGLGDGDGFVAEYDLDWNHRWSMRFGGSGEDVARRSLPSRMTT